MSDFPLLLASEMGVSRRTVQRWCEAGKVPGAYRTKGGHWRLRKPRIKRNGKWNYDENITEFVIRYTSDGGYFPPPIPNSLLVDAVKKWIRRLQKNPAPLTAEEAGTLEWARTIIDRQTADEMEQLTASQESTMRSSTRTSHTEFLRMIGARSHIATQRRDGVSRCS